MAETNGSFGELPLETIPVGDVPVIHPLGPSPTPGVPPVSVGSLLSRIFSVWGRSLPRLVGHGLLMTLPVTVVVLAGVLGIFVVGERGGDPNVALAIVVGVVALALGVTLAAAQLAGATYCAFQTLADRPFRFGHMVSVGFARVLPVIAVSLLAGLPVALGFALALVPGLFLACGLAAVVPLVVVERLGPVAAMRRSWALTRGHRWTILATAAVMVPAVLGVLVVGLIFELVPLLGMFAALAIDVAAGALFMLWPAAVYHDLRVEKEGAASDDLARVFE